MQKPTLYYIHDPMCSWCWGFKPVWNQVENTLSDKVDIHYVLGGLTTDTDQPMPTDIQTNIKNTWRRIQLEIPGTEFNFDFWTLCQPRRSTYLSCRAVIAAGLQSPSAAKTSAAEMLFAIQQAYYLQAKNPSDSDTLIQIASDIGLNSEQFSTDLFSEKCEQLLQLELQTANRLGISSFPSLMLDCNGSNTLICLDYNNSEAIVSNILIKMQGLSG